jgi:hypothetical protein
MSPLPRLRRMGTAGAGFQCPARDRLGQSYLAGLMFCPAAAPPRWPDRTQGWNEMWFIAECQDCKPVLKNPYLDMLKHEEWVKSHVDGTGHEVRIWMENDAHEQVGRAATISRP